jgi:5-carboxymethyl-2-hydroxymuconate isomerase
MPRHKMLLWRIINNSLPVRAELNERGVQCPILCPRCNSKVETTTHLFMHCPNSEKVWFGSQLAIRMPNIPNHSFSDWLTKMIMLQEDNIIVQIAALTDSFWHARNQAIFEDTLFPESQIIQRAASSITAYIQANMKNQESPFHIELRVQPKINTISRNSLLLTKVGPNLKNTISKLTHMLTFR